MCWPEAVCFIYWTATQHHNKNTTSNFQWQSYPPLLPANCTTQRMNYMTWMGPISKIVQHPSKMKTMDCRAKKITPLTNNWLIFFDVRILMIHNPTPFSPNICYICR
jgi:hypothetical protein